MDDTTLRLLEERDLAALQILQTVQHPRIRVVSSVNEQNGRARFDVLMEDGEWYQLYVIPVRFANFNIQWKDTYDGTPEYRK